MDTNRQVFYAMVVCFDNGLFRSLLFSASKTCLVEFQSPVIELIGYNTNKHIRDIMFWPYYLSNVTKHLKPNKVLCHDIISIKMIQI